uniref:Uncharacterized protein n=1 Tax=Arundo donax TaxID=35708 RepID=A0A0A9H9I9_ARUDO
MSPTAGPPSTRTISAVLPPSSSRAQSLKGQGNITKLEKLGNRNAREQC